jgi:Cu(I)/Ag(I) efflux system membrane fusion protein
VIIELGEGRFAPRPVTLGHAGEGYVEILEGIEEGDRVVTSAQFLIDSEANLQEAIQKMVAQRRQPMAGEMSEAKGHGEGDHAQ